MATPSAIQDLTDGLIRQSLPTPDPSFLQPLLTSTQASRPLATLVATAKHRLLSADLTSTTPPILASSNHTLPPNISSASEASTSLQHDIFVQVLEIEDLSRSKWEQVEALESERKGEMTKGREIIRVVPSSTSDDPSSAPTQQVPGLPPPAPDKGGGKGPFKLLMQDWKGNTVVGFELARVEKIGYPPFMGIGCKLWLRKGAKVARGMVLLEPGTVVVVGGLVGSMDRAWREGREQRLRDEVKKEAGEVVEV